ncbi:MAG: non-ribosomal peptide synthetase, partial [Betaproteobacteria bacterium]
GVGLARGYLNRPELTAERFVPDPFSVAPGARMYRTGDLARYFADGNIAYLGRIDDQVKIRGFRIELGEIEAVLGEHAAVRQAVVTAREDTQGEKRLVAYVVPADASLADIEPLRAWLRERLPEYMRPSVYVVLEGLPLTPSGKVDRRALPAPQYGREEPGGTFVPPRRALEELITEVWREVLKLERVGVHDNFFELGGHSLLAARMIARVRQACGREMPLRWAFEAPTVAELAARIETAIQQGWQTASTCAVAIQPHGDRAPLFFVSGFGGAILPFQALARELGPEQPLYVLDVNSLSDLTQATVTLESVATQMLNSMRMIQPRGPYNVAGYSLGGKIVYEIAQQLDRDRETIGLLALLDCSGPGYPRIRSFPLRAVSHVKYALSFRPRESVAYLAERFLRLKKYFKRASPRVYPQVFREDDPASATEAARAIQARAQIIADAWRAYIPQFYPGRLTLVRAEVRAKTPGVVDDDVVMGWGKLAGKGIDVARLHCAHSEMLHAEHAQALARLLHERLTDCESNTLAELHAASVAARC